MSNDEENKDLDNEETESSNLIEVIEKYKKFLTDLKSEYIILKESESATAIFDEFIALLDKFGEAQNGAFQNFFNDTNIGSPFGEGLNLIKGNSYSEYIEADYKYRDVRQLIWDNLRKYMEVWSPQVIEKLDELIPPIKDGLDKIQEEYNKFKEEWDRRKEEESNSYNDTIGETLTAPSGRKYTRHISNMGTIMEFNDGQDRRVLILDAQYRSPNIMGFGTFGNDSPLSNYTSSNTIHYDNGPDANPVTDDEINSGFPFQDANTSKHNCDVWMTYSGKEDKPSNLNEDKIIGVPAVEFCRSITVDGSTCDLPNIQTLIRIFCDAEFIDSMDPTAKDNPLLKLGRGEDVNWVHGYSETTPRYVWTSTENSAENVWSIQANGDINAKSKRKEGSVIPILELAVLPVGGGSGGGNLPTELIAPSGRRLYRHKSNMGTVIEFNDGIPRWVLVVDAIYRSSGYLQFGTNRVNTSLPDYRSKIHQDGKYETFYYLFTQSETLNSNKATTKDCADKTDEWINANLFKDSNTGKQNCDILMSYIGTVDSSRVTGVPALKFCRDIAVDGQTCVIPNFQTLARIICDADALDSMDPSVSQYPERKLSTASNYPIYHGDEPQFRYPVYSSTEESDTSMWCAFDNGVLTPSGKTSISVGWNSDHTSYSGGKTVIPVIEYSTAPEKLPDQSSGGGSSGGGSTSGTASSGRKLYRHDSNMGTVMEYNDGITKKVLILDAKYRSKTILKFGTYGRDSSLINIDVDNKNPIQITDRTDDGINKISLRDPKTSKANCDVWMGFRGTADYSKDLVGKSIPITGVPAVEFCRSIIVNGSTCNLPNIQILARIYADRNEIDALDPTLSSSGRGLGSWSIGDIIDTSSNYGQYPTTVCSSSEASDRSILVISNNGLIMKMAKSFAYSVIPILEL